MSKQRNIVVKYRETLKLLTEYSAKINSKKLVPKKPFDTRQDISIKKRGKTFYT